MTGPNRFTRFAARRGRRAVVLLGLIPVLGASFGTAMLTRGAVSLAAAAVYLIAGAAVIVIAWQLSFGGRDA